MVSKDGFVGMREWAEKTPETRSGGRDGLVVFLPRLEGAPRSESATSLEGSRWVQTPVVRRADGPPGVGLPNRVELEVYLLRLALP